MKLQGLLIRLIVIKKVVVATLLLLVSVAASISSQDMGRLALLADDLVDGDRMLLANLAQLALNLGPDSLRAIALVTGTYALLVYLAAWAAWNERRWGDWLLVVLMALPLPYEVFELITQQSPSDAIVSSSARDAERVRRSCGGGGKSLTATPIRAKRCLRATRTSIVGPIAVAQMSLKRESCPFRIQYFPSAARPHK